MAYQVLARKWRPQNFTSIIGQPHVVIALSNALKQQRIHHAYLLTGTRGVGKTTIARVFAKALSCEQGITANPCNQCACCIAINENRWLDLIEVDAASRTKVEDTRELLNNVLYPPVQGRFKIYIIDEVHMLSNHSFNALLKTLEEPPEHVKFILATTDPQKLPITILSRCLQFNLKAMTVEQMTPYLQDVLTAENIPFDATALSPIAQAADGSMRDALSILDQAIVYGHQQVRLDATREMLGLIDSDILYHILTAIHSNSLSQLMQLVEDLAQDAVDFAHCLTELLTLLYQIARLQKIPELQHASIPAQIVQLSQQITAEDIQLYYQIALTGRRDLPLAPTLKMGFEMLLLRMATFTPRNPLPSASKPQQTVASPTPTTEPSAVKTTAETITNTTQKATPSEWTDKKETHTQLDWSQTINQLTISGMTRSLASHCAIKSYSAPHCILQLPQSQSPLLTEQNKQRLQQALTQHLKTEINLTIELVNDIIDSPVVIQQAVQNAALKEAEQAVVSDKKLQAALTQFDAEVVPGSLTPLINDNERG